MRVLMINTGGTIVSADQGGGLRPSERGKKALRQLIEEGFQWLEWDMVTLMMKDSSLMLPDDWRMLAQAIYYNYDDYDAFLVFHGTDTMAYTASALSFALRGLRKPVVLTGAMKSILDDGSDAPTNIKDSIMFIREALNQNLAGVYIVFNRKAILGVRATKKDSVGLDAFDSVNYPIIATISNNGVNIQSTQRRHVRPAESFELGADFEEGVAVLKAFPGMRPWVIDAVVNAGARGLLVEAYGTGGLSEDLAEKLGEVVKEKKVPVVVTTQPLYGGVDLKVYEVGRMLLKAGAISACDMTKEAAVVKLMWVLKRAKTVDEVRAEFAKSYEDEVDPSKCEEQMKA